MTGGNLLAYSALTTKIKAMHSKLLTNEQYEELAHFTTVADAFAYLQKLPYYEELLQILTLLQFTVDRLNGYLIFQHILIFLRFIVLLRKGSVNISIFIL